jgi:non-heme chloroperoxidase
MTPVAGEPWTITEHEAEQVERANTTAATPVVFVHGLVPWAVANASYKLERRNNDLTEIVKMKDRGHALTIDNGWREVAETALAFVKRFT